MKFDTIDDKVCCSLLQCVAMCCRVLQRVIVFCSVLQCVNIDGIFLGLNSISLTTRCCSVLQCVAVCCILFLLTAFC